MLEIVLFVTLLILGIRAFLALRRELPTRREFGQPGALDIFVLLYPLGPLAVLAGRPVLPLPLLLILATALFAAALLVASKERANLECAGTDRVKNALAATHAASLGAIVGVIYVVLSGIFAFISHAIQSQPLGA